MKEKNFFSLSGLVFLAALASLFLACPNPTSPPPAGGNNPPTATFPPTGYQVSSAGTAAVNGNYVAGVGLVNGFAWYTFSSGPYYLFKFAATNDTKFHWGIHDSTITTAVDWSTATYYIPESLSTTTIESAWAKGTPGLAPAPTVLRMPISGSKAVGGTLTAHYIFLDLDGDAEVASQYQWYSFANSTDTTGGTPIGTSISYITVAGDNTLWLRIQVTPIDEHGAAGSPVLSDPVQVGSS